MKIALFILSFLLLFLLSHTINSQSWPKIYSGNFHSFVRELNESYDRGYILTGYINSPYAFSRFISVIKTDINGNICWQKKFGDLVHQFYASNSEITTDNGLIISGATTKYSYDDFDPVFIKTNTCGEIEWCRILTCPDVNYGTDVIQTQDESYIGLLSYYGVDSTYSRISLVKMNQYGEPIWIQRLAQEDTLIYNEEGDHLYLTNDNTYMIAGQCFHPGVKPFWIKTDTSGNQNWDLMWEGGQGGAYQTAQSAKDFFYSTGAFRTTGLPFTPAIFKFDNLGTPLYMRYLLGDTIYGGEARSISTFNDSTLLIGLSWQSIIGIPEEYYSEIFKIDTLGAIFKRRLLLNSSLEPEDISTTEDNKILVTGNYMVDDNFNIYLWKMNSDLEDDSLYTQSIIYDSLCPYQITSDTVDLDCDIFVNLDDIPAKAEYESTIKISPNPARDWIMLTFPENIKDGRMDLAIYNLFGQIVLRSETESAHQMVTLNVSGLATGLYVVVSTDKRNKVLKGKFIVTR